MSDVRRWRTLIAVAVLAVLPGASGCGPVTEHASAVAELVAQADAAPTPTLDWAPCVDLELSGYDCATARVPLDYARPEGETIALAVLRQRASDPDRRIGSLFVGAGGPGGSGLDRAASGPLLPGEVSRRFDVVTFDQRGVGRSAPVKCFVDDAARQRFWSATTSLPPATVADEQDSARASREFAQGCATHSSALLPHLTTVDAARDLDLLRRAVGETLLTYQGGSYASYLGIVYGALFGERVRALQLSSMIDPDSYTRDTRTALSDTAVGTEEVLAEFLRSCATAGRSRCAFAGSPGMDPIRDGANRPTAEDLRTRDDAVLERLRREPITVGGGETAVTVRYGEAVQAHALLLYDLEEGWPALARLLIELERGAAGDAGAVREILSSAAIGAESAEAFTAISCADHTLPMRPDSWPATAAEIARVAPVFGPLWWYLREPCASWPVPADGYPQRYEGPWTLISDKPAMLLNNRYDPVTPLVFAQRAQGAMVNARLVTVSDGYGHTPSGECAARLRERYLVDLQLPAPGATCTADLAPFPS